MLPLVVAVLLQTRFAAADAELATAALASPRPHECRGAVEDGLWSRLRTQDAQRYCALLARGYARLERAPNEALSAAQAARAVAGPLPAVRLLSGRAELRLARAAAAFEEFAQAEAQDAQAFVDPKALHDYARAASLAGKPAESVRLYRSLAARAALLDDTREITFVQIEAAAHVLAYAPAASDEALGYLAQARRESLGLSFWIEGLRSVALQRSGRSEPRALNASSSSPRPLAGASALGAGAPLLPPEILQAIRVALAEAAPRSPKSP